nr:hypothetical protein [uncultured Duganella sp.]
MNPLIYSLCQKPVIGVALFASTMCAFPPLFADQSLPLQQGGASVVKQLEVTVGKPYFLDIGFAFPSAASHRNDEVAGSRYDDNCARDYADIPLARREGLGRPIPIHVLVRDSGGAVTMDKVFNSLCIVASRAGAKTRTVGRIDLAAGNYTIEVDNVAAQAGLDGVKTTVSLVAGHGK